MFNNWINPQEIIYLFNRIRNNPGKILKYAAKMHASDSEKVKNTWSNTDTSPTNWWDIPTVQSRWNYLISGNKDIDYNEYIAEKYFKEKHALQALSLGCGGGERELRWAKTNCFSQIEAYDLSPVRIEHAIKAAKQSMYGECLDYRVGNIYEIETKKNLYDVVFAEQSLHHFSPLKELLLKIEDMLKPEGCFILNEFVGPTRFQWTNRQLELVNSILSIFPERFKTLWHSNLLKPKVIKHSQLSMVLRDPSEAIESANILPLLKEIFEVVELKGYGGSILHLLLGGIAHHFLNPDDEAKELLRLCFELEDFLIRTGEIDHDFMVAVCYKRV
ncbi:class I SAM-dependent methyltransferase [Acaryochloris sp. CCMEE 5410]|uniref:class I SAM-dependent methyltransferase n=1 Tax=Acaryochloris sp. CCMEE 5410 TaxID=310037 RepID=UPI00024838BD|nr:class I SAM-dependent methyltransferase [Acaryochloris sp. CCMEE 5410]KAI9132389.1 class I SAM-dependent methyltransferase [Acaryochloris sp. CCMEE 5410]